MFFSEQYYVPCLSFSLECRIFWAPLTWLSQRKCCWIYLIGLQIILPQYCGPVRVRTLSGLSTHPVSRLESFFTMIVSWLVFSRTFKMLYRASIFYRLPKNVNRWGEFKNYFFRMSPFVSTQWPVYRCRVPVWRLLPSPSDGCGGELCSHEEHILVVGLKSLLSLQHN